MGAWEDFLKKLNSQVGQAVEQSSVKSGSAPAAAAGLGAASALTGVNSSRRAVAPAKITDDVNRRQAEKNRIKAQQEAAARQQAKGYFNAELQVAKAVQDAINNHPAWLSEYTKQIRAQNDALKREQDALKAKGGSVFAELGKFNDYSNRVSSRAAKEQEIESERAALEAERQELMGMSAAYASEADADILNKPLWELTPEEAQRKQQMLSLGLSNMQTVRPEESAMVKAQNDARIAEIDQRIKELNAELPTIREEYLGDFMPYDSLSAEAKAYMRDNGLDTDNLGAYLAGNPAYNIPVNDQAKSVALGMQMAQNNVKQHWAQNASINEAQGFTDEELRAWWNMRNNIPEAMPPVGNWFNTDEGDLRTAKSQDAERVFKEVKKKSDFKEGSQYRPDAIPPEGLERNGVNLGAAYRVINTGNVGQGGEGMREGEWEDNEGYAFLTFDERDAVNYLINNGYYDEAAAALEGMRETLLQRRREVHAERDRERARLLGPLAFAASGVSQLMEGAVAIPRGIKALVEGYISPNDPAFDTSYYTSDIRDTQAAQLDDTIVNLFGEGARGVGSLLYGVLGSGLDMAAAMGTGSIFGKAAMPKVVQHIMSSEAFGSTYKDAIDRKIPVDKAFVLGSASYFIEGLTEKYSIEQLLKTPDVVWKYIAQSMGTEASEEAISEIANIVTDVLVAGDQSRLMMDYQAALEANGGNAKEAAKQVLLNALKDTALSALGGALMGGGISTVVSAPTAIHRAVTGSQIKTNDTYQKLQEIALAMDEATQSFKVAKEQEGKKITNAKAGRLFDALMAEIDEKGRAAIVGSQVNAIEARLRELGETAAVEEVAAAVQKVWMGQKVSKEELKTIAQSKHGTQVQRELMGLEEGWAKDVSRQLRERNFKNYAERSRVEYLASNRYQKPQENKEASELLTKGATTAFKDAADDTTVNLKATVDGKEATIQGVERMEGGNPVFSVQVGEEVRQIALPDMKGTLDSYNMAAVVGAMKGMTSEAANTMLDFYKDSEGISGDAFARGWQVAYNAGRTALGMANVNTNRLASALSQSAREAAYAEGEKQYQGEKPDTQETAPKAPRGKGKVTFEKGVDLRTSKLNPNQRRAIGAARLIAKVTGVEIRFFQSKAGEDGKLIGEQGEWKPGENVIRIDLNAGKMKEKDSAQYSLLRTASHELTHFIATNSQDMYRRLQAAVIDQLTLRGQSLEERIEHQRTLNPGLSEEKLIEEVIAEACEMMLNNSDAIERLARKDMGLAEYIAHWLEKFYAMVREAFAGVGASSAEAQLLTKAEADGMVRYSDELQKLWDDALVDAVENGRTNRDSGDVDMKQERGIIDDAYLTDGLVHDEAYWRGKSRRPRKSPLVYVRIPQWASTFLNRQDKTEIQDELKNRLLRGETNVRYISSGDESRGIKVVVLNSADPLTYGIDYLYTLNKNAYNEGMFDSHDAYMQNTRKLVERLIKELKEYEQSESFSWFGTFGFNDGSEVFTRHNQPVRRSHGAIAAQGSARMAQRTSSGKAVRGIGAPNPVQNNRQSNRYTGGLKRNQPDFVKQNWRAYNKALRIRLKEIYSQPWEKWGGHKCTVLAVNKKLCMIENQRYGLPDVIKVYDIAPNVDEDMFSYYPIFKNRKEAIEHLKKDSRVNEIDSNMFSLRSPIEETDTMYQARDYSALSEREILAGADPNAFKNAGSREYLKRYQAALREREKLQDKLTGYQEEALKEGISRADREAAEARAKIAETQLARQEEKLSKLEGEPEFQRALAAERQTLTEAVKGMTPEKVAVQIERLEKEKDRIATASAEELDNMSLALEMNLGRKAAQEARKAEERMTKQAERAEQKLAKADERIENLKEKNQELRQEMKQAAREAKAQSTWDVAAKELAMEMNLGKKREIMRKAYEQRIAKLKSQSAQKMAAANQRGRDRLERYKERTKDTQSRSTLRDRIKRKVHDLDKLLRSETDVKHVPPELKSAAAQFLMAFTDDSSVFRKAALDELRYAYGKINEANIDEVGDIANLYDPNIAMIMDTLRPILDGRRLSELDQLETRQVLDLVDHFTYLIKMANKAFFADRRESISTLGLETIEAADKEKRFSGKENPVMNLLRNGMLTPAYFFKKLGGPLKKLYDGLKEGESRWGKLEMEARDFFLRTAEKHHYWDWNDVKGDTLTMTTQEGHQIVLTREQALGLYATWKRENSDNGQEAGHLREGGFVYEDAMKQDKKSKEISVDTSKPNRMSDADMVKVSNWLTDEQRAYADEMVAYMSGPMAELGNEVSMTLFGYKKYNESYYFPYQSSQNYIYTPLGQGAATNDNRLKHASFSNQTVKHANNPIIASDFTTVWAGHVNHMILYGSMCVPLENFNRVYNYRMTDVNEETGEKVKRSVKASIEGAYGRQAMKYIETLMTDLNGGMRTQSDGIASWLTSRFKKNAVFASLSVVAQQPSSIVRAMALVDPKYFAPGIAQHGSWDELKKYSGTAIIKEMGGFDTATGRSTRDWLLHRDPKGMEEKGKAFIDPKDSGYRDEVMGKLPALADRLAWTHLWRAVKAETLQNTGFAADSQELLEAAGKRFDEVVSYTQVYDSVLSKSQVMRSKDGLTKMTTAFMAEPTLAFNLLADAFTNRGKADSVKRTRAVAAYTATAVVNAILKSIVTAARDDDDRAYGEKYLGELVDNFTNDANPINLVPYARDVWSIFQGYDVERADMSIIADLKGSLDKIMDKDATPDVIVKEVATSVGMFLGLPVKNVWRDTAAVVNVFNGRGKEFTPEGAKYAMLEALPFYDDRTSAYYARLLDAYLSGNTSEQESLTIYLTNGLGKAEKTIKTQTKTELGKRYKAGKVDDETALDLLTDVFGVKEADAYWQLKEWKAKAEFTGEDDEFSFSRMGALKEALSGGNAANIRAAQQELLANGYKQKEVDSNTRSAIKAMYKDGSIDFAKAKQLLMAHGGTDWLNGKDKNDWYWLEQEYAYDKTKADDAPAWSKYNRLKTAMETNKDVKGAIKELLNHGVDKGEISGQISDMFKETYRSLYKTNKSQALALQERLLDWYVAAGYKRDDRIKHIKKYWLK